MNAQNYLGNLSFLSLFASMTFYWIGLSFDDFKIKTEPAFGAEGTFGEGLEKGSLESNQKLSKPSSKNAFSRLGRYGIMISNILLGLLLLVRWKESGHFPLSNLYESLMFLSWSFTVLHLFFFKENTTSNVSLGFGSSNTGNGSDSNNTRFSLSDKLLGAITTPSALFTNAFATFTLPKEMQEASPLVPALQSNWLMMHVTVMILSYAALILGSLLSLAFLIVTFNEKEENINKLNAPKQVSNVQWDNGMNSAALSLNSPLTPYASNAAQTEQTEMRLGTEKKNSKKMKLAFILDNLSYRILGIGFPFLTIGILSGAVWANEAWGSYWSWDPKETWALLTWLIFAIYLHTRLNKGWEGKKPAIIASFGFVIVWICYLGVNLIGEGLHSYGWMS